MKNHPDNVVVQYLQYGFPPSIDKEKFNYNQQVKNHPSTKAFPKDVEIYLEKEKRVKKAMVGPYPRDISAYLTHVIQT